MEPAEAGFYLLILINGAYYVANGLYLKFTIRTGIAWSAAKYAKMANSIELQWINYNKRVVLLFVLRKSLLACPGFTIVKCNCLAVVYLFRVLIILPVSARYKSRMQKYRGKRACLRAEE